MKHTAALKAPVTIKAPVTLEEILNAVTHGVGAGLAVAALVGMLVYYAGDGVWHATSCLVYGISLILLYLASTLYHSFRNLKVKGVFKVIDHAAIFVLIAGNYTPFALIPLHGSFGWTVFGLVWSMAVLGIIFQCFAAKRFRILRTICYLVMGWFAVFMVKPLLATMPLEAIWWLVAGGLCYSVGAIFYLMRRLPYSHVIWHLFVMWGSAVHFYTVFHYVLPLPEVMRSAMAML